ncbi:cation:proton antiporter [Actinomadura madurae]|nr:cation:proton antiporter [Actinomadura madurae]MCP9970733.1 cation:proton antiporter [Actinomadura madurae]
MPTLDHIAAAAEDPNLQLTLKVLPALVVVLLAAGVCGRLALMVGQPRVLGEMVAGVLLGPTLFGQVWPDAQEAVFPAEVRPVLYVLSNIGLTLYMFLVGAGLDHGARTPGEGRRAPLLAASGMLPSVLLGFAAGLALWGTLSRPDVGRWEFALFVGGALSLTAFPMLARILYERGLENSPLGPAVTAGGVHRRRGRVVPARRPVRAPPGHGTGRRAAHDRARGPVRGGDAPGGGAAAAPPRPGRRPARRVRRHRDVRGRPRAAHGRVHHRPDRRVLRLRRVRRRAGHAPGREVPGGAARADDGRRLHAAAAGVLRLLRPQHRAGRLAGGTLLLAFLVIMAAGFCGKYFGCALAMRGLGFGWRESYAVGALMNARGLMILIFINIGLAQGMITRELFAMLVLVAVITTASAVPLYRLALPERLEPVREADPEPVPNAAA